MLAFAQFITHGSFFVLMVSIQAVQHKDTKPFFSIFPLLQSCHLQAEQGNDITLLSSGLHVQIFHLFWYWSTPCPDTGVLPVLNVSVSSPALSLDIQTLIG